MSYTLVLVKSDEHWAWSVAVHNQWHDLRQHTSGVCSYFEKSFVYHYACLQLNCALINYACFQFWFVYDFYEIMYAHF